ncbi:MAG: flagellar assembly protein FliW [Desulfopila sp.]
MKTITTRFGEVEYDPANLLHFPTGLIGFPQLHDFVVMPNTKEGPLFWIQSVDDSDIAFVLTDPSNFFLDYAILPDQTERQQLQISGEDQCFILAVVTVPRNRDITLNLSAPILFAPKTNRALQIIVDDPRYTTKTPLPN